MEHIAGSIVGWLLIIAASAVCHVLIYRKLHRIITSKTAILIGAIQDEQSLRRAADKRLDDEARDDRQKHEQSRNLAAAGITELRSRLDGSENDLSELAANHRSLNERVVALETVPESVVPARQEVEDYGRGWASVKRRAEEGQGISQVAVSR